MAGKNVTTAAASSTAEMLALEYTAEVDGYMYIYTANETLEDVDVFFDDLTIMHTGINIMQSTDYYPYGLVMRESKNEHYRFGYQGQFAEMDSTTGWHHFELRQYDSRIGRWLVVDPMGQYYSPYLSMGNNPVNRVDPDGGLDDLIKVNTETGMTEVYETSGPDVLFVDGQYLGISGVDGDWRYQGYDNVAYYPDMSYFFNNTYGDLLLNENFFVSQFKSWNSLGLGGMFMEARTRQGINANGTLIAGISVGVPLAITGGAELAMLAPTISSSANSLYWRAGEVYNKANFIFNDLFYKGLYVSSPLLGKTKLGKELVIDLVIRNQLQGFDIARTSLILFDYYSNLSSFNK